jgi:tetratricopeptide (TPR) repeat protein
MASADGNDPSLDDLRQMGNHHFAKGEYDSAVQLYTMAIDKASNDQDARILNLCNRSACLFKMERYEDSHADALQAFQTSEGEKQSQTISLLMLP